MIEGIEDALRLYRATDEAASQAIEASHMAIVNEYRRQRDKIPDDTGALRRSLTDPRDRAHVVITDGDTVAVGSSVRAARYQARRLPRPDPERVTEAVFNAYNADIGADRRG